MPRLVKAIASVGGLGYLPKCPGTFGSLAGLGLFLWAGRSGPVWVWGGVGALLAVSLWLIPQIEGAFKTEDPTPCVLDEVWGMGITLLGLPTDGRSWLLAFALFRLFDIWKPPPIRRLEHVPSGWGIFLDDLAAGVYANLTVRVLNGVLAGVGFG